MIDRKPPSVFLIGFNLCGSEGIVDIFRANGYKAKHWTRGSLAEEIIFAKGSGETPFQEDHETVLFADLESVHKRGRPFLEAFKEYEFLHQMFPNAVFVLNTRCVENWIINRLNHRTGAYARFHASFHGVDVSELPEIWLKDWENHLARSIEYFREYDRFIYYNIEADTQEKFIEKLSKWFHLSLPPKFGKESFEIEDVENLQRIYDVLTPAPFIAPNLPAKCEKEILNSIVSFSLRSKLPESSSSYSPSKEFSIWDGESTIERPYSSNIQLTRTDCGDRSLALVPSSIAGGIGRVEAVINDLLSLTCPMPLAIDMQDARSGSVKKRYRGHDSIICYNRSKGSIGLVLWPLAGYHTIGDLEFFSERAVDKIPFSEKKDMVVWRGNLTGRPLRSLVGRDEKRRSSIRILQDYVDEQSSPEGLLKELRGIPRFAFVSKYRGDKDFDVGFTLGRRFDILSKRSPISEYCTLRQPPDFFHQYRYIACISGHDGPSNFPMALMTKSVVFKENDDWELFYSDVFKPWEHYIPLEAGAQDADEKLEWARQNPNACQDMISARAPVCRLLGRRDLRMRHLAMLVDCLR